MTDPAVEAAHRYRGDYGPVTMQHIGAAREALKPIRELHKPVFVVRTNGLNANHKIVRICDECQYEWPCETAPLIYTTEELERT